LAESGRAKILAVLWVALLLSAAGIDLLSGIRLADRPLSTELPEPLFPLEPVGEPVPVIVAAGDVSCVPGESTIGRCHASRTADLIEQINPDQVLVLGDTQYEQGELENFLNAYEQTWGRFKRITRPAVGNHEYATKGARGYFDYFNGIGRYDGAAGKRDEGYYSFNLGAWHLIALNSECGQVACGPASRQLQWLERDLSGYAGSCVLAYWHHPRFSSGHHGNADSYKDFWQTLFESGADVILVGHDHIYERLAPLNPQGQIDARRGIRQFTVGTGGRSLHGLNQVLPSSQFVDNDNYGVLKMELLPDRYKWQFIDESGEVLDSGEALCH
jgi:acid phosphatase type 7